MLRVAFLRILHSDSRSNADHDLPLGQVALYTLMGFLRLLEWKRAIGYNFVLARGEVRQLVLCKLSCQLGLVRDVARAQR
mmetsp:Transcript_20942/g.40745  ORF Transcript_20942/g.40745 Transcript_20942/m.40745 type:complete len:80 (+) Transcript_20942:229-468(+)